MRSITAAGTGVARARLRSRCSSAVASQYTAAVVPVGADRWPMWRVFAELGHRLRQQLVPSTGLVGDDDILRPLADRATISFD